MTKAILDHSIVLRHPIISKPAGPLRKHAYFGGCFFTPKTAGSRQ